MAVTLLATIITSSFASAAKVVIMIVVDTDDIVELPPDSLKIGTVLIDTGAFAVVIVERLCGAVVAAYFGLVSFWAITTSAVDDDPVEPSAILLSIKFPLAGVVAVF